MHTIKDKSRLLARARRIGGQVAALEKQLVSDGDCTAVLQQIAAIRGAVNGLMAQVIEGHLQDHVISQPDDKLRQAELEPVLKLIQSYLR